MAIFPLNRKLMIPCLFLSAAIAAALPASASLRVPAGLATNAIHVSVSFNSQFPLADSNEETIAALQRAGRKMLYRMASKECKLLLETVAATCRLKSMNVSSQLRQPNSGQASIYLNGSAQYAITLKADAGEN